MPLVAVSHLVSRGFLMVAVSGSKVTAVRLGENGPGTAAVYEAASAVRAVEANAAGEVFVSTHSEKDVIALRFDDGQDTPLLLETAKIQSKKRVSAAVLDPAGRLLLADRAGTLAAWKKEDRSGVPAERPHKLESLTGQVAVHTDVVLVGDKQVATADKDGKIRVSMLPQTYCIKSFCLGHEGFVSRLLSLSDAHLVSGGADGTVRLWAAAEGRQLACVSLLPSQADQLEEDARTVTTPLAYDAAHRLLVVALGPRVIFLQVTEEAKLVKTEELLMGGDALAAATDSAATLYVAVDGVPYIVAYNWVDGKYQEATDGRSKAVTALLRENAVKEGTEQEASVDRQLRSWNEFVTKGKVVNAHNKRRKVEDD